MTSLQIDCTTCVARDVACADCVVSVLLNSPPAVRLSPQEQAAIRALAESGLVPPLRHQSRPRAHLRSVRGSATDRPADEEHVVAGHALGGDTFADGSSSAAALPEDALSEDALPEDALSEDALPEDAPTENGAVRVHRPPRDASPDGPATSHHPVGTFPADTCPMDTLPIDTRRIEGLRRATVLDPPAAWRESG